MNISTILLLICLLFLGLLVTATLTHMPRAKEIELAFSLKDGFRFKVRLYKKQKRV